MDKNNDGVVTMDEFLETCQKVNNNICFKQQCSYTSTSTAAENTEFFFLFQDGNIMQSMHMFDNVI